ncbi:MAG: hypothetical protein AAFZ18_22515 [Myxococcota bacterium]
MRKLTLTVAAISMVVAIFLVSWVVVVDLQAEKEVKHWRDLLSANLPSLGADADRAKERLRQIGCEVISHSDGGFYARPKQPVGQGFLGQAPVLRIEARVTNGKVSSRRLVHLNLFL